MIHKTLKATTTATDKGQFSALAATYSVDRMKERILPGAFEKTIQAWKASGKNLPLHWDHGETAHEVIGFIDPASMQETKDGLYVEGRLDLNDSEVAKEAWRSMKNNTIALSFGYLFESRKGKDGVRELTEIDLFEITLTPAPVNADTRVLSLKSIDGAVTVRNANESAEESHAAESLAEHLQGVGIEAKVETEEFEDIEAVKSYVAEKFPNFEVTEKKSESDLQKRSLDIALEVANNFKPREQVEPEPEPPEPVDSAEVRRLSERAVIDAALL